MIRAHAWGDWPGADRDTVTFSQEDLRDMEVVSHASDLKRRPRGTVALWWDRYGAPDRSVLMEVTVVGGAWRWNGRSGGRVACAEMDPRRAEESLSGESALGYRLVHAECPALDRMVARREG